LNTASSLPTSILSGGQTGVDRAALDIGRTLAIPSGGWCPCGRKAEDGTILPHYRLRETPSADYAMRTEWNVRDSNGTLILSWGIPRRGTALTVQFARCQRKPYMLVDLSHKPTAEVVRNWLITNNIRILNIAGPRESECSGIYAQAAAFLRRLLDRDV
jgi:hypothetical protein